MAPVGIIGSGAWGTTLALLLANKGIETVLWEHRAERAAEMVRLRENALFLPGFSFPAALEITDDLEKAADHKEVLILVTPSQRMRENVRLLAPYVEKSTILLSASKGIEVATLKRMSEIIAEELPGTHERIAALSGPNLAREVAEGKPTAAVVAAHSDQVGIYLRTLLSTARYRVYTTQDIIGIELGGALKNIIAIGAGINDGMGYGENARAAFITRGLAEITRLGIAAGAHPLTFAGLAGLGDLVATCSSPLSRNHQLGRRLAAGEKLADILATSRGVAEGVTTTRAALQLAARYGVEMPITEHLARVLFEGSDPYQAVLELMMRDPKGEMEGLIEGRLFVG
jgi:glycerol-3-phosphate dehydrogenase (NAD(P)+)